jgi:hypothetical protein
MPSTNELKRKKTKKGKGMKSKNNLARKNKVFESTDDKITDTVIAKVEVKNKIEETQSMSDLELGAENGSQFNTNLESDLEIDFEKVKKEKKSKKMQLPNIFGLSLGTQLLKSKFPKSFGIAEKVVEEWVSNGDFKDLPIDAPLVQFYLGESLRRVKNIEKKIGTRLDDAGVLPIVKHQIGRAQKWINKK